MHLKLAPSRRLLSSMPKDNAACSRLVRPRGRRAGRGRNWALLQKLAHSCHCEQGTGSWRPLTGCAFGDPPKTHDFKRRISGARSFCGPSASCEQTADHQATGSRPQRQTVWNSPLHPPMQWETPLKPDTGTSSTHFVHLGFDLWPSMRLRAHWATMERLSRSAVRSSTSRSTKAPCTTSRARSSRPTGEVLANSTALIRCIHSRHCRSLGRSSKSRSRSVSA